MKKIINGYERCKPIDVPQWAKSDVNGWSWVERCKKQTFWNGLITLLCWPWKMIDLWKIKRGKK